MLNRYQTNAILRHVQPALDEARDASVHADL